MYINIQIQYTITLNTFEHFALFFFHIHLGLLQINIVVHNFNNSRHLVILLYGTYTKILLVIIRARILKQMDLFLYMR